MEGAVNVYYFDKNGELVDDRESVLESFGEDNDTELDLEDKILLFEAMMRDILGVDEFRAYVESNEYQRDLVAMFGESELVTTESVRSRIRLSTFDELKRLAKMAVYTIARKKKNPKMKKIENLQKKLRKLEAELAKEHGTEAIRMAKDQLAHAKKNVASNTAKKAVKKAEPSATKNFFRYVKK